MERGEKGIGKSGKSMIHRASELNIKLKTQQVNQVHIKAERFRRCKWNQVK